MNIKTTLLLLYVGFLPLLLQGQDKAGSQDVVSYFQERLATYWSEHPTANLYLHLDKNRYAPEEMIWFKAYVLSDTAIDNRVLYVRLVDERRHIVLSGQFPMYDIRAHGSLVLPKRLGEGKYTLYAYTDRMVSLGDTSVFVQPLQIRKQTGRRLQAEAFVADTMRLLRGKAVSVTVRLRDLGSPARRVKGEYQLVAGGREIKYGRLTTNDFGETTIDFTYPNIADSESLEVKILFNREGDHTELSLQLPHEGTPLRVQVMPEGGKLVSGIPARVAVEVLDDHGNPVSAGVQVVGSGQVAAETVTDKQGIAEVRFTPREGMQYVAEVKAGWRVERVPFSEGVTGWGYSLRLLRDRGRTEALMVNRDGPSEVTLILRSRQEVRWSRMVTVSPGDSVRVEIPSAVREKEVLSLGLFDGDGGLLAERLFLNREEEDYRVTVKSDEQVYGTRKKVTVRLVVTDRQGNPVVANVSAGVTEQYGIDSADHRTIVDTWRYGLFGQWYQQRLVSAARGGAASLDALLLSANWRGSGWNDISGYVSRRELLRLPYTDGAYGKIIPEDDETIPEKKRKPIHEIYIESPQINLEDLYIIKGKKDLVSLRRTPVKLEADCTFYLPASFLLGREWTMDLYKTPDQFKTKFTVEWMDPDIGFDSTVVKGNLLRSVSDRFGFAQTNAASAFAFDGVNALAEVVIGAKARPQSLKDGCPDRICSACGYLNCRFKPAYPPVRGQMYIYDKGKLPGGKLSPLPTGTKVIYMSCSHHRNINYIKTITIPDVFYLTDYNEYQPPGEDLRSTIFWEPNLMTDEEGKAVFSFFTSDTMGGFDVTVQGLDIHTLRPLVGAGSFKVE